MSAITYKAFDHDGVIFGGAVRDTMIADAYTKKYYAYLSSKKERFQSKKFWDINYHPETAARTLVPRDLDICFEDRTKSDNFIMELDKLAREEQMDFFVTESSALNPTDTDCSYAQFLHVRKVTLTSRIGQIPLLGRGYSISIDIDIVSPRYKVMMQAPFNNLDFLCNGFIKTKHGIMYSQNTGTYIDKLSDIDRTAEILKIQQDMLLFKTHMCKFEKIKQYQLSRFGKNKNAFKRVHKLLSKETFEWTIENLPFKITKTVDRDCYGDCCICFDKLEVNDTITYMPVKTAESAEVRSSITHKKCILEYLVKQQEDAVRDNLQSKDEFSFICPMRHTIDFTSCSCTYKD
jgi:hypothetical protein